MIEIKAPNKLKKLKNSSAVFLAGSIDQGKAVNWQDKVKNAFANDKRVTFWNPRRDDWDSSWEQDINFAPFKEQVTWELKAIEQADIVVFYFDPNGQAPITLMELGLQIGQADKDLLVCCPNGYWRKGNVDIICDRYGIPTCDTLEDLISDLDRLLNGN